MGAFFSDGEPSVVLQAKLSEEVHHAVGQVKDLPDGLPGLIVPDQKFELISKFTIVLVTNPYQTSVSRLFWPNRIADSNARQTEGPQESFKDFISAKVRSSASAGHRMSRPTLPYMLA